jgi:hypothetical protein
MLGWCSICANASEIGIPAPITTKHPRQNWPQKCKLSAERLLKAQVFLPL